MLKLSVLHDLDGNIAALVAYPPDAPPAAPANPDGLFLAHIDMPDIHPVKDADAIPERLDNLRQSFRVQAGEKPRLVRFDGGSS